MPECELERLLVDGFFNIFKAGKEILYLAAHFDFSSPFYHLLRDLVKSARSFHPTLKSGRWAYLHYKKCAKFFPESTPCPFPPSISIEPLPHCYPATLFASGLSSVPRCVLLWLSQYHHQASCFTRHVRDMIILKFVSYPDFWHTALFRFQKCLEKLSRPITEAEAAFNRRMVRLVLWRHLPSELIDYTLVLAANSCALARANKD